MRRRRGNHLRCRKRTVGLRHLLLSALLGTSIVLVPCSITHILPYVQGQGRPSVFLLKVESMFYGR